VKPKTAAAAQGAASTRLPAVINLAAAPSEGEADVVRFGGKLLCQRPRRETIPPRDNAAAVVMSSARACLSGLP